MSKQSNQLLEYEQLVNTITRDVELNSTSLTTLFRFWFDFFYEKIIRIFIYENLPFPFQELEGSAIINGKTFIAYDDNFGFVTRSGSIYGVTRYPDVFTDVIYSMPSETGKVISGKKKIGKDAVVLYNTATSLSMVPFLNRYASLATHFDLTLKSMLINLRYPDILASVDSDTKDSIDEYFTNKYNGLAGSIIDTSMLVAKEGTVNLNNKTYTASELRSTIDAQNELLRSFYRDIGLRWIKDKRANVNSEEIDGNDSVLLFNTSDMLYQRHTFVDEVNRVFASRLELPVTVKLNPAFINMEGNGENETSITG